MKLIPPHAICVDKIQLWMTTKFNPGSIAEAVNSIARDSYEVTTIGGHGTLYGKGPVVHMTLDVKMAVGVAYSEAVPQRSLIS